MLKAIRQFLGDARKAKHNRPRLSFPAGTFTEIFSIGDVHGCLKELIEAEHRILNRSDLKDGRKLIVMTGDYVDRGPDSAGVLDHLTEPPPAGFDRICVCGNHDDAFHQFMVAPRLDRKWLSFGGETTLQSYDVDARQHLNADPVGGSLLAAARERVPAGHVDFLRNAPVALSVGRLIFVHAGMRPGITLDNQSDSDLMWIREPFLSEGPTGDVMVIHGHTPADGFVFGRRRVGIDVGAYATGRLQVLRLNADGSSVL